MTRAEKYATMAAAVAAVATSTMPEVRTWFVAGPCWAFAAWFGVRWWSEANTETNDSSLFHLGDLTSSPVAVTSSPSSTLATLKEMGFRFDRPPVDQAAGRLTWHAVEERFGRISGEVQVIWQQYTTGHVVWSVYSRDSRDGRTVDRFISEARIAGRMARDYPTVPRKFPDARFEDEADNWLNIVATFVRLDMVGSGRDERGEHESGAFERAVDASKLVCARLASEAAAGTSSVAMRLLEHHHRVVHEILNVAPPTQDQRGPLAAEWIPKAQQWDRDVVQAMRELGCTPDEVHYVETFPLPTTNRRDCDVLPELSSELV